MLAKMDFLFFFLDFFFGNFHHDRTGFYFCRQYIVIAVSASFQMIVESNFAIAIARHTDWLKDLPLVFQKMRNNTKLHPEHLVFITF